MRPPAPHQESTTPAPGLSAPRPGGPRPHGQGSGARATSESSATTAPIWAAVSPLGDFYLTVVSGQRHHWQGGKVRLRYLAAACAAIGLLVSACGGSSSSSGSSGSGSAAVAKQITIWTTN